MHELSVSVLGVSGRQSKNGQHTIYDVALSDGQKYSTFDADMANKANALSGQQVVAHVEVKQNGKYTNYNLEAIGAPGTLGVLAPQAGTPIPLAAPGTATPVAPQTPIQVAPPAASGGWTPEKEQRVTKLAVLGTAFKFVGALFSGAGPESTEEAKTLALGIAKELFGVAYPEEAPAVPATPAEVAAAVPGVQVGVEAPAATTPTPLVNW